MAPRPLFFYGPLRDPDLLCAVLGRRPAPGQLAEAVAPGFGLVHDEDAGPALVRAPGARTAGLLLLGVTPFELDLLDAFEGPFYRRAPVPVIVETELHEIETYLAVRPPPSGAPEWSFEAWRRTGKPAALAAHGAAAAALRARLLAARPN